MHSCPNSITLLLLSLKTVVAANEDYDLINGQKVRTEQIANAEGLEAIKHIGLDKKDLTCLGYLETEIPYNKEIICKIRPVAI